MVAGNVGAALGIDFGDGIISNLWSTFNYFTEMDNQSTNRAAHIFNVNFPTGKVIICSNFPRIAYLTTGSLHRRVSCLGRSLLYHRC